MQKLLWWCALSIVLVSCGGGGGNSNDSVTQIDPNRDRAFAEEVLFRVRDRADVDCQTITCKDGGEHGGRIEESLGSIIEGCIFQCAPSEIDTSGEVRHYWVVIRWSRTASTCFGPPEGDVTGFFQHQFACEPTF